MRKEINFTYEGLKSKNGARCREKNVSKKFPHEYKKVINFKKENNLNVDFPQLLYLYFHNMNTPPVCVKNNCNNPLSFESYNYGYKGKYCSTNCANSDEEKKEKTKETYLEKYGVEHISQSPEIQQKIKETLLERYGVENIMHLPDAYSKIQKIMLEKYGVDNAMKLERFFKKAIETNKKNNGGIHTLKDEKNRKKRNKSVNKQYISKYPDIEFINSKGKIVDFYCGCNKNKKCSLDRATFRFRYANNIPVCNHCNPLDYSSYGEKSLQNFIKSIYDKEIILNDRKILNGKELDILIPDKNLAIEYNGLYWHSDAKVHSTYHLEKTKGCKIKQINLLHIFEDEWINKPEIVQSIIRNKLGIIKNKIYARKTTIKEISTKQAKTFLNENHIQGYCNSAHKIGLFYNKELISVMTFGSLRKSLGQNKKENHYELLRFANKTNTLVLGGASKLFKYFVKYYTPTYICSYANRRYFNGKLYNKLGLTFSHETDPNYFYIKKTGDLYLREPRFKYRKDVLVNEGYDPNKTEREIMQDRGFLRIYDCGTFKFEGYY